MTDYQALQDDLYAILNDTEDLIAGLSNASALINEAMDDLNWCGFYRMKEGKLVLGPFQGKVACVEIEVGAGVCGTAVWEDRTQRVDNVHDFDGHIACDSASNSEIVIPIHDRSGSVFGVLDIDSPSFSRFTEEDRAGLEACVKVLEETLF